MNGADLLVAELKRQGVEWVSTLSGNGLLYFYPACVKAGIRLIDVRNEQAAAYMADAYARLTGRVGVCAVSSGIAHNNALTGIANAYFDGSPVILITGASPGYGSGRGVFQEFDQVGLAAPICKYATMVDRIGDMVFKVRKAFAAATSGRPGPVHLTITEDAMQEEVKEKVSAEAPRVQQLLPGGSADPQRVQEVVELLNSSKRPLLVAGTNLFYAGGQPAMIRFSEIASIPILTPIWDRGVIEKPHPNFLGAVGFYTGQPKLLPDADLIILAGGQVDYRIGYLAPPELREDLSIVRIDIDPQQIRQGVEPDVEIVANPDTVFNQLVNEIEIRGGFSHKEWLSEAQNRRRLFLESLPRHTAKEGFMTGRELVEAIKPLLTEDVIYLIDGGNIGQWAHHLMDCYPSRWLTCGASAVVGWGIPGAMAARLAFPDGRILLLSGDGAFGFTIMELASATRQGLSFVAIVAVDEVWGAVESGQLQLLGEEGVLAHRTGHLRYDQIAKVLGANGLLVESPEELASAVHQGFASNRPTVIHVFVQSRTGPQDR